MNSTAIHFRWDARQVFKITVYALLLVNFVFYVLDDIEAASYEMRNGGSLLDWTAAFATTIDESAWFILLFLFEFETHLLSDEVQARPVMMRVFHAVRIFCYAFLAHSVYAFGILYWDLLQAEVVEGVTDLCQLVGTDIYFIRNLDYSEITAQSCATLSTAGQFYYTEPGLVVSDARGLALETWLALVDWLEVISWLLILATIEMMVRLQDRSITRGPLVSAIKASKVVLYSALWAMAAWWAYLGHYYFAWDETLWIVGFLTIEGNMAKWKEEIEEAAADSASV